MACETCTCIGEITDEQRERVKEIINYYKGKTGILIQVLHEAQQVVGYLPREIQEMIAEGLDILSARSTVLLRLCIVLAKPKGRNVISVCKGTACYVKGVDAIMEKLEEDLGIKEKTLPMTEIFGRVRCMGACGLGPVVRVNEDIYARVKSDQMKDILDKYE